MYPVGIFGLWRNIKATLVRSSKCYALGSMVPYKILMSEDPQGRDIVYFLHLTRLNSLQRDTTFLCKLLQLTCIAVTGDACHVYNVTLHMWSGKYPSTCLFLIVCMM